MRVLLLAGGSSAEREVSLASARGIAAALRELGHDVRAIDVQWGPEPALPDATRQLTVRPLPFGGAPETEAPSARALQVATDGEVRSAEVVFVALHGGFGEDGGIQTLLEFAGVRYTGSGRMASALAMDKDASKRLFRDAGIPTPDWRVVRRGDDVGSTLDAVGLPAIIKPVEEGSTVGLSLVEERRDLPAALDEAWRYGPRAMIECYVPGRELTVGILDNRSLPIVEIIPSHGLYDYACKYTPGMSSYHVPAQVPDAVRDRMWECALGAFKALGCDAYARVDFRLDPQDQPWCLEVNTLPGMTETSLLPKAAAAVGISYPELVERISRAALRPGP
jgi:D-alanine-D-alanine ligase